MSDAGVFNDGSWHEPIIREIEPMHAGTIEEAREKAYLWVLTTAAVAQQLGFEIVKQPTLIENNCVVAFKKEMRCGRARLLSETIFEAAIVEN